MDDSCARVAKVEEFIEKVTRAVNEQGFIPRTGFRLDATLFALLSKSLTASRAVCLLVKQGFPEEAFAMSRTVLDVFFTARYIANQDSFNRANTFVTFTYKTRKGWWELIQKYYAKQGFKKPENYAEILAEARNHPHPHWWTGRGDHTKYIACEGDAREVDDAGQPISFEFYYAVVYKFASEYVHVNTRALAGC